MNRTLSDWRLPSIGFAFLLAFPILAVPAALSPEIQVDRLSRQADREIEQAERPTGDGSFIEASAILDRALDLRSKHDLKTPVAFWLKHAQAAHKAGLETAAGKSANRHSVAAKLHAKARESIMRYLGIVGQGGGQYSDALDLLDAAQKAAAAVAPKLEGEAEANAAAQEALDAVKRGEPLEMVTIRAGCFRMGCVSGGECYEDEKPVRWVHIEQPFEMSKYEVTFAQWDACVLGVGCGGYRPNDEGWGRGNRPVINVSWDDAQLYVKWLSEQTGHAYRLPTEAQWEYAARAGTTTAYSWGDDIGRDFANCDGCGSQRDTDGTAPVGSLESNDFGLHDMHGNVWEWVEDCWNENYAGAPRKGCAWQSGDCGLRTMRGGSWNDSPTALRSAYRQWNGPSDRYSSSGFRVVRSLPPETSPPSHQNGVVDRLWCWSVAHLPSGRDDCPQRQGTNHYSQSAQFR